MLNILCEEKIPFAHAAFSGLGDVTLCKGNRLTSEDLKFVDVLIIRSGTQVDANLLDGTPVHFVATATAGIDHVDVQYLQQRGIPFHNAPGCNAVSVVEYVIAALLKMANAKQSSLFDKTVGVVGAGAVGGRLAGRLSALGMNVLVNDPPLLARDQLVGERWEMVALDDLLQRADIVSLHVPLIKGGAYPTHHLVGMRELLMMKPGAWLINAARGGVVSNVDLLHSFQVQPLGATILDVWENEPVVDRALYGVIDIGTPHIAGHSYEGKVNGTIQVYDALTKYLQMDGGWDIASVLQPGPEDQLDLALPNDGLGTISGLHALVRQMYDIESDDRYFRRALTMEAEERGGFFLDRRKNYPRRRTYEMHTLLVKDIVPQTAKKLLTDGLGISVITP